MKIITVQSLTKLLETHGFDNFMRDLMGEKYDICEEKEMVPDMRDPKDLIGALSLK